MVSEARKKGNIFIAVAVMTDLSLSPCILDVDDEGYGPYDAPRR